MKNTGVMCLISVYNPNSDSGISFVDLGNYYINKDGNKCVILTKKQARMYSNLIDVLVYVRK